MTKNPNNDKKIVYLVESFRDEKNRSKQRIIKSFGQLSDLIKDNPNALEEIKTWAKRETESIKHHRTATLKIDFLLEQDGSQKPLNYGYTFLESIYNQLNISDFIDNYSTDKPFKYDLDSILKLLVFSRALNPKSKRKTFEKKVNYFFELKDFSLDDLYRSLDHLSEIKDDLMVHLNEEIASQGLRDASLVFYDVTNYYFESDETDGFRETGVSKENQTTGIVQMGLFIDNNGLPITYELFPGNTNDLSTMRPILEKIKKQFNLGKLTIVADKGNNSASNLAMIEAYGDDYIISQRIRNRGNTYSNIVLNQEDYQYNQDHTFKYKLVSYDKEVKLEDGSTKVIHEHLMCFWSKDEEFYQRAKRGLLEDKIQRFLNEPALLNASNSFGIKKYFKKVKIDPKTGEILKGKDTYVFNKEKYDRDLALDGYYTIVTNNLELHPFDIIKHYRQLSKIEESFKVTKTDLEGRPIYVWTKPHIKGHFLTCYLALLIYRILQMKLDHKYPVHQIKEALNSANVIKLNKHIYLMHDTDKVFKEMSRIYELEIDYKYVRFEVLKKELKKIR
jgi:transposase